MSMQPRRRQLLRIVGTACLASGTGLSFAASSSRGGDDRAVTPVYGEQWVASANAEAANQWVGSSFEFWSVHGRAAAVLSAVNQLSTPRELRGGWALESFEMIFTVTESTRNLPRDLCHVAHPQLGSFELFVQSIKSDKGSEQFLAYFTRVGKMG